MIKRYDCTDGGAQFCQGCYTMEEESDYVDGNWVRAEDYDASVALLQTALKQILTWCNLHKAGELSADGAFAQIRIDAERCLPADTEAKRG